MIVPSYQRSLGEVEPQGEERSVTIMLMHLEVDDFDAWKPMFDQDPGGRRQGGATSHMISRGVDNPNEVFIRVEFPTTDQAKAFRQKLVDSRVLERAGVTIKTAPTVAEVAETVTY
jgi:hypothetical protein